MRLIYLLLFFIPVMVFSQDKGTIYILTNEAIKGYVKIGVTSRDIQERVDELYTTSVPYPFVVYFAKEVDNYELIEKQILSNFSKNRKNSRREFLKINPAVIKDFINKNFEGIILVDNRRPFFSFSHLGIQKNTKLKFKKDKRSVVTVLDDRFVLYKGETFSLSKVTANLLDEGSSQGISALHYWVYQGKTLAELRAEQEQSILSNEE